jgi:hypothetical protein
VTGLIFNFGNDFVFSFDFDFLLRWWLLDVCFLLPSWFVGRLIFVGAQVWFFWPVFI